MPACLACTSGTAAANYAPAVIEAHEARVPLLVLTADRPPELRDIGAGQTIDQIKLYGSAAKWFFEVDDHPASPLRVRWLRQLACRAFWTARRRPPGPGAPELRVPRAARAGRAAAGADEPRRRGRDGGRPWVTRPRVRATPRRRCSTGSRGELARAAAGGDRRRALRARPALGAALAAFAERARVPAAGRPAVGRAARAGRDRPLRRAAARRRGAAARARSGAARRRSPDVQAAARVAAGARDALQIAFDPEDAWQDPAGAVGTIVAADPRATFDALLERLPARRRHVAGSTPGTRPTARAAGGDRGLARLRAHEPRVAAELGSRAAGRRVSVRRLLDARPRRRDLLPGAARTFRVLSNRGANGIDGTVSTAFGVAAVRAGRSCC